MAIQHKSLSKIQAQNLEGRTWIHGVGCVYGDKSLPMDDQGTRFIFKPGCFSSWLGQDGHDVRILKHHNEEYILARQRNGTVIVEDTSAQLNLRFALDSTNEGKDTEIQVRDGLLTEMSVGFILLEAEEIEPNVWLVTEAYLDEVSIVTVPAMPNTNVWIEEKRNQARRSAAAFARAKFESVCIDNRKLKCAVILRSTGRSNQSSKS